MTDESGGDRIVELTWVSRDAEADAIVALLTTQGIVAYSQPTSARHRGGFEPRPIMVRADDVDVARALLDRPVDLPAEFAAGVWDDRSPSSAASDVSVSRHVNASPDQLFGLVSDVTRMGEWSPETTSCRWLAGATGPAIGARFRGTNERGWRRWATTSTVVQFDPPTVFAFDVRFGPIPVSTWTYRFEVDGGATRATESWTDRRPRWFAVFARATMGVTDIEAHNADNMASTLERLAESAERRP